MSQFPFGAENPSSERSTLHSPVESSSDICQETSGLSHRYAQQEPVLTDVNLKVPRGSIYGFLGPNGAGKTTTLRLILGLLRKQKGTVSVFGKDFETHRIECLTRIGSLI